MKYRNAAELLPAQLLQELQRYAAGGTLYIPAARRQPWGEGTGAKTLYARRNAEIRSQFSCGVRMDELSDAYFLSDETVRKIIYQKGELTMATNAIDYSKYFWQNELVRVRRARTDDWKQHYNHYDSECRFYTDYEQELPFDETRRQEGWENYIRSNENNKEWVCLAFETLDGEYVGGGNLQGLDEHNGVFGMFLGAKEQRYALAAARLMLDYAFNERRMNRCDTGFMEGDTVNMELFEALGFKKEGIKRQQVFHQGRYWDEHLYGLLAEEFNAGRVKA